ncbi:MAG: hypothetical protein AB7S38_33640 [Vulcanimicrobiota bacterium]
MRYIIDLVALVGLTLVLGAARPQQLLGVSHNGSAGLRAGDFLQVDYHGKPGRLVSFGLPGIADGWLMEEIEPGVYRGSVMILPSFGRYHSALQVRVSRGHESSEVFESERPVVLLPPDSQRQVFLHQTPDGLRLAFDTTVLINTLDVRLDGQPLGNDYRPTNNYFEVALPGGLKGSHKLEVSVTTLDDRRLSLERSFIQ